MATGTTTIDFGSFPGTSDASVAITGQGSIVSGSLVEAWLRPVATADHSEDEHMAETIKVVAGNIVPGTGFTIYGLNTGQINEQVEPYNRGGKGGRAVRAFQGARRKGCWRNARPVERRGRPDQSRDVDGSVP